MELRENATPGTDVTRHDERLERAMEEIRRAIKNVRFGSIEITIHDSRVVQIQRTEKVRLAPVPRAASD